MLRPKTYVEGGRAFLAFPMDYGYVWRSRWAGFLAVEKVLRRGGWSNVDLEHMYTEENYGQLIAHFEVMPRV